MEQTWSLRQIEDVICEAEHRSATPKLFLQLKGLAARNLLQPIDGYFGPKRTLLFPQNELARARLLVAAVTGGVEAEDLARLNAVISYKLQAFVDSLQTEARWELRFCYVTDTETGEAGLTAWWVCDGVALDGRPDVLTPAPSGYAFDLHGVVDCICIIRATDIVGNVYRKARV